MIRTQIQLTEEQSQILKRLASLRKVSVAELIRQGIDFFLKVAAPVSPDKRKKSALDVVGKFQSGLGDLSTKHDDYFAQDLDK